MEMYREGYETYCLACENYGMESMNFYLFVKNLTVEQLNAFNQHTKGSDDYEV
ncbi:transcriptional regulator [Viridibacillus arvi]|uniref:transcriptional regulator n=1 Tax=Viridibacillus arvi TaxID=263475 RepID=UPI0034CF0513